MVITESFSRGFGTYKKYFWEFLVLSMSKSLVLLAFVLVSLALILPVIGVDNWYQVAAYVVGYIILLVALLVAVMPFFTFPLVSGAVMALKKRPNIEPVFGIIRKEYTRLLIGMLSYGAIVVFAFAEAAILTFIYPVFGLVALIAAAYVCIRLCFWDVLAFMGEKHPLRASWKLTEGRVLTALGFLSVLTLFAYFLGLMSFIPLIGALIGLLVAPFFASAKVHFTDMLKQGLKKGRA